MAMRPIADPMRIAILGGGIAALSAAYELSHPRQQGRFAVTVYQLGWRLGGKCASGRDLDLHHGMRIKEHGPHLLFGFYDNGFEMMEECYSALQRPASHPFQTFEDAVIGSNDCCVMEKPDGPWAVWDLPLVALAGKPGAEGSPTRWEVGLNAFNKLADQIQTSGVVFPEELLDVDESKAEQAGRGFDELLDTCCDRRLAAEARDRIARSKVEGGADRHTLVIVIAVELAVKAAISAQNRAAKIKISHGRIPQEDALALAHHLRCTQHWVQFVAKYLESPSDDIRHWIILGDLGATTLLGATLDELLLPTPETLLAANRCEYRDWLRSFGALQMTVDSAVVRALYDTVFGYVGGDISGDGNVEAGSTVRAQLELISSRGSIFWKMRAGTGDVIAAPLYECLVDRGVDFQFFTQVEELVPSADGRGIAEVHIIRQAEVLAPPYHPLRECKGIPVWPDRPDLDQLKNGQSYKDVDFESGQVPENPDRHVLKANDCFHALVLGIGLGGLPSISACLSRANADWEAMLTHGRTVATQSLQLWIDKPTSASGWQGPVPPIVTSFDATPFDTWLDATHVIKFEDWDANTPAQMAMICGPFADHAGAAAGVQNAMQSNIDDFFKACCVLWPNFCKYGTFDPSLLRARFTQSCVNPSDRYVQTPRDSSRFRLPPGRSGFSNMVLAGDWTDYGLNLGCFEGAVISGRLAANALGGRPRKILRKEPQVPTSTRGGGVYVEHHPPQTLGGPIAFPAVNMWAFFLRGQIDTLTNLCRRFFDVPTGGRVTFSPLSQAVIMTISELPHAYFVAAPERGKATEREIAFAIPGEYTCRDAAGRITANGVATFMPYLFVDNPIALLTGREVLGYFKLLGEVGLPGRAGAREDFFLNVFGAQRMAADVEWSDQRLLTVTGRDATVRTTRPAPVKETDHPQSALPNLQGLLKSVLGSRIPGRSILAIADVRGLLTGSLSQIFLKQFRAEGSGHLAAYQAVTIAEYQVTRINSVRPTQSFDIVIHPLASIPIATELGLSPQMVETGFEVNFDMTLSAGRVLWRA